MNRHTQPISPRLVVVSEERKNNGSDYPLQLTFTKTKTCHSTRINQEPFTNLKVEI